MSRLIVFIASISVAFVAISSACLAAPAQLSAAAPRGPIVASTDDAFAGIWPSSSAPSRIVGGGLLSL